MWFKGFDSHFLYVLLAFLTQLAVLQTSQALPLKHSGSSVRHGSTSLPRSSSSSSPWERMQSAESYLRRRRSLAPLLSSSTRRSIPSNLQIHHINRNYLPANATEVKHVILPRRNNGNEYQNDFQDSENRYGNGSNDGSESDEGNNDGNDDNDGSDDTVGSDDNDGDGNEYGSSNEGGQYSTNHDDQGYDDGSWRGNNGNYGRQNGQSNNKGYNDDDGGQERDDSYSKDAGYSSLGDTENSQNDDATSGEDGQGSEANASESSGRNGQTSSYNREPFASSTKSVVYPDPNDVSPAADIEGTDSANTDSSDIGGNTDRTDSNGGAATFNKPEKVPSNSRWSSPSGHETGDESAASFTPSVASEGVQKVRSATSKGSNTAETSAEGDESQEDEEPGEDTANSALSGRAGDCAVLKEIYDDMGGSTWTSQDGWTEDTDSCCQAHGVSCDANGRVTALDLGSNGISGSLSNHIFDLASLSRL